MGLLKQLFDSSLFKIAVGVLTAVFTAVRFSGLAFPQYAQTFAVFGLALCLLFFVALAYQELLARLIAISADRSELLEEFQTVKNSVDKLTQADFSGSELFAHINSIENDLHSLQKMVAGATDSTRVLDSESLYESLARRYGYANESVKIECLLYRDGSARVERRVEVRAFAKYDEIDTYLTVPAMLNAEGEKAPRILEVSIDDENRRINHRVVDEVSGRSIAVLTLFPPLVDGALTTYRLVERTPVKTFMLAGTAGELAAKAKSDDPDEYFGWNINRPTKSLQIKVIFPEGFIPREPRSQVYFASVSGLPSIQLQTEEQQRIMAPRLEPTTGGGNMLYLEVSYPLANLIYMLRWIPQLKQ